MKKEMRRHSRGGDHGIALAQCIMQETGKENEQGERTEKRKGEG